MDESSDNMDTAKAPPSWPKIEADYRAGIKSLRQMAAEHGISEAGIRKRSKREEWSRDLSEKIRATADALVRREAVRRDVRAAHCVPEKEIVEANAALQSSIILSHRRDIQRARGLTMSLLDELERQTDNQDLLEQLREFLYAPDDKGVDKRDELFRKVVTLGSRSTTMKTLADSLRGLIILEREAFGLNNKDEDGKQSGVEDVIKRVMAKHEGLQ
ncbi:hypothetical protein AAKU55_005787 [Oxalobacteraceae bacterium GrIS 1.11]